MRVAWTSFSPEIHCVARGVIHLEMGQLGQTIDLGLYEAKFVFFPLGMQGGVDQIVELLRLQYVADAFPDKLPHFFRAERFVGDPDQDGVLAVPVCEPGNISGWPVGRRPFSQCRTTSMVIEATFPTS